MYKLELSGMLARWVQLSEEFDYTVEYNPNDALTCRSLVAIIRVGMVDPIDDRLVHAEFFVATAEFEWYAGIADFLTIQ